MNKRKDIVGLDFDVANMNLSQNGSPKRVCLCFCFLIVFFGVALCCSRDCREQKSVMTVTCIDKILDFSWDGGFLEGLVLLIIGNFLLPLWLLQKIDFCSPKGFW